jgi:aldoxime dehydratase
LLCARQEYRPANKKHFDRGGIDVTSTLIDLEPAIPPHLRAKRTQPLGAEKDFVPSSRSFSIRFDPSVKTLPMVYFGVQHRNRDAEAERAMTKLIKGFGEPYGPEFWDRAMLVDRLGYTNLILVGYWKGHENHRQWEAGRPSDWWHDGEDLNGPLGLFKESYTPGVKDTETTFSHKHPEGYAHLSDDWSEPTDTHDYWGSARDRIARAQTDPLDSAGKPLSTLGSSEDSLGRHVHVAPHENLCLLRSGQDWSETEGEERSFYLGRVEPILNKGMMEIRDEGVGKGCFYNRYMNVTDTQGAQVEKTYSLSAWNSISDIEHWVRQATHLAIYHIGVKHYQRMAGAAKLRLYHEMFVLRAGDQQYEYFNCHSQTGMLNATRV